jgi:hypothetical protein
VLIAVLQGKDLTAPQDHASVKRRLAVVKQKIISFHAGDHSAYVLPTITLRLERHKHVCPTDISAMVGRMRVPQQKPALAFVMFFQQAKYFLD